MAAPTKRCPFKAKFDANTGLTCENTECMAYDSTNETCKILEYIQVKISFKDGGFDPAAVASLINN